MYLRCEYKSARSYVIYPRNTHHSTITNRTTRRFQSFALHIVGTASFTRRFIDSDLEVRNLPGVW